MCQYDKNLSFDIIWFSIYDINNKKIYRCEGNPSKKRFEIDKR